MGNICHCDCWDKESDDQEKNLSQKDNIQKDNTQKDNTQKDNIQKINIQKINIQKDNIQKDNIQKDNTQKDNIQKPNISINININQTNNIKKEKNYNFDGNENDNNKKDNNSNFSHNNCKKVNKNSINKKENNRNKQNKNNKRIDISPSKMNEYTKDTSQIKSSNLLKKNIENKSFISSIMNEFSNYKENSPYINTSINNENINEKEIINISQDFPEKFANKFKIEKLRKDSYKFLKTETIISFMSNNLFTDSEFNLSNDNIDENEIISLGINIGAQKTVYSIFSKINEKYISHVLLMNNSSRIIPSIICYTKTHRLFGENSITSLKQNLDTSHINLSRLIGFSKDIKIYENEINYELREINNMENFSFYIQNPNGIEETDTDILISDFLFLINKYYFKNEKYNYTSTYISIPDFYTFYQKQYIDFIINSLNMKDVNIINESSAITMYYGYTKYRDNFVKQKTKVDTTIEKYILFIDSGYSKTSFILSYFKYNLFKVINVISIPNIGGRNFDEEIMNYCINEFLIKENIKKEDFQFTQKMKYRLLESIKKSRIQLTVNTESLILVDVFFDNIDLNIIITRDKFEELIKKDLEIIDNTFNEIIKYSNNNKIKIDCVEIAGELMRTPILQKMIENKNLKISKSLLIDECTSVGAALIGNYLKGKLPIANYKFFFNFNYYKIMYQISFNINESNEEKYLLLDIGCVEFNNNEKMIYLKKDFIIKNKPIYIKIFYDRNNNNNIELFTNNFYLKKYEIDLYQILIDNNIEIEKIENNSLIFKIKFNQSQCIMNEQLLFNNQILNANIKYTSDSIYKSEHEKKKFKNKIYQKLKIHKNFDAEYNYYINYKNAISKHIYSIKPKIKSNPILNDEVKEIEIIEKKFRSVEQNKNVPIEEYEIQLKKIILNIIIKLLLDMEKNENNNNNQKQSLENMKNKLNNDLNNFDIKEFVEFLNPEEE